jgi:hypothetical protein
VEAGAGVANGMEAADFLRQGERVWHQSSLPIFLMDEREVAG